MRAPFVAALLLLSSAAVADDTRPPQISDVHAGAKGGRIQIDARITDETGVLSAVCHHRSPGGKIADTPMIKDELDDVFRVAFPGGPGTEYWIEATDMLGNGPAAYGSAGKPFSAGNAKAVATAEPPRKRKPREQKARPVARATEPPVIEHSSPATLLPEGEDLVLQARIHSGSPVAVAVLQARPLGGDTFTNLPLAPAGVDTWQARMPATMARGAVEYFIAAKDQAGRMTRQGNGDSRTPWLVTFKSASEQAGPFLFTDNPPFRVQPGRPIVVRAQVVPRSDRGEMPDRVAVLWRGIDAQDQMTDMVKDETGGWGGYKASLPPQEEGAIFYQLVACDAAATKCSIDTGSRRKWHATVVSSQAGASRPLPLDAVSSKAPPSLPE
jgi:hypothetical protein